MNRSGKLIRLTVYLPGRLGGEESALHTALSKINAGRRARRLLKLVRVGLAHDAVRGADQQIEPIGVGTITETLRTLPIHLKLRASYDQDILTVLARTANKSDCLRELAIKGLVQEIAKSQRVPVVQASISTYQGQEHSLPWHSVSGVEAAALPKANVTGKPNNREGVEVAGKALDTALSELTAALGST